ncbi:hypothetical protein A2U01_0091990, partial [Trifolium medium]|nr:hypothetical protein [Trifolium medium]
FYANCWIDLTVEILAAGTAVEILIADDPDPGK